MYSQLPIRPGYCMTPINASMDRNPYESIYNIGPHYHQGDPKCYSAQPGCSVMPHYGAAMENPNYESEIPIQIKRSQSNQSLQPPPRPNQPNNPNHNHSNKLNNPISGVSGNMQGSCGPNPSGMPVVY